MIADIDFWRAAKALIDRYGDSATIEAMKRADALAAQLWFTEGFDTTDLKDAKALLDELD